MPPFSFLALLPCSGLLPRRHLHLLKQLGRHGVAQAPSDGHGAFAAVGGVGGGTEEGVRGGDAALVLLAAAYEEEDGCRPSS